MKKELLGEIGIFFRKGKDKGEGSNPAAPTFVYTLP